MTNNFGGPRVPLSQEIDGMKYRQVDETFHDKILRLAESMSDDKVHEHHLQDILGNMRFLPAGRVQAAMGSRRITTAFNCFVSETINDSMGSIMSVAAQAAETMRRGGGIGYDFSKIRPRGDRIKSLDSEASGPVSFMGIFDAICQTISSSGHRRGAQMGVLRVDHPDIKDFLKAKRNSDRLTGFNISVAVTDKFMEAVLAGDVYELTFEGHIYGYMDANEIWDMIMESTWDWAEPGILFIDRINYMNNLNYCEEIAATNPCGEQPLPPHGACLLGSFNLTKYLTQQIYSGEKRYFNWTMFAGDIAHVVRAMDNVIDRTIYPLKEQSDEAKNKRRMGLGITGLANTGEMLGLPYGSPQFLEWTEKVLKTLRDYAYLASIDLAQEKGPFTMFREEWLNSGFAKTLPTHIRTRIRKHGLRNSHLLSIAPTGTISLVADNVSSGIEPVFSHYYDRTINTPDGVRTERVEDFAYREGVKGRTANSISVLEHLSVLALAQQYVDSAVSKTCNVGDDVTYDEFKHVYLEAWKKGCKGVTTFRAAGKRYGILQAVEEETTSEGSTESTTEAGETQATACFFDPVTGQRECS